MEIHRVYDLVFEYLFARFLIGLYLGQCHVDRMIAGIQSVLQLDLFKPAAGRHQTGQKYLVGHLRVSVDG